MKRKYQKEIKKNSMVSNLTKPFYKAGLFFILFCIFIGDSVLLALRVICSIPYFVIKYLLIFLRSIVRLIFVTITSIRLPSLPKLKLRFSLPSISLPSITLPSFSLPKPSMPSIPIPKMPKMPKIQLLKLPYVSFSLPHWNMPKLRLPSFPKIRLPHIKLPSVHLPSVHFSLPKVNVPKVTVPKVAPPRVSVPKIQIPKFSLPVFKLPAITLRMPPVAFLSVKQRGRKRKNTAVPVWLQKQMRLFNLKSNVKFFIFGISFAAIIMFVQQGYIFVNSLPNPKLIGSVNYSLSTHIYDRDGKLLYEVYRDQNRTPIRLDDLPEYVLQAAIAIEDKDFYHHNGISIFGGIIRAFKENLMSGDLQGGSTITQQLVKSALLTPERTIERKVKEVILALWAERLYSKKQILEMYFNQVPYGGSAYGIEEASKTYLGKSAKDLTLSEAALLAGLPQAPSYYSPHSNPDAARGRRNTVLNRMREQGYISQKQEDDASKTTLSVIPPKISIKAPHFVFYVKNQLSQEYGIKQVEEGGLRVHTTLDLDIQEQAEKILQEELDKVKHLNVTNGAILVTKPATGEILAMVGSADYFATPSGAFNVTTALRQPGSSIKPVTYSLALERGYSAASILDDTPVSFGVPGSEIYRPVNYDGKFHGRIPFRLALANSYNIPAVRLLNAIGVTDFVNYARDLGITTWEDSSRFGLSLTLGGGEVTMVDMSTVFGVFANKGYRVSATGVVKLENANGNVMEELDPDKTRVVSEENSYIISDILSDNFARQLAFGPRSSLEVPGYKVAVKTGTTDNKKDNWTIGYTPDYVVTVWVGNNDGTPMHPTLTSGITGASPIWNRMMTYLVKNEGSSAWYEKPSSIVERVCYFGRKEVFRSETDANTFCNRKLLESSNPSTKPSPVN